MCICGFLSQAPSVQCLLLVGFGILVKTNIQFSGKNKYQR